MIFKKGFRSKRTKEGRKRTAGKKGKGGAAQIEKGKTKNHPTVWERKEDSFS